MFDLLDEYTNVVLGSTSQPLVLDISPTPIDMRNVDATLASGLDKKYPGCWKKNLLNQYETRQTVFPHALRPAFLLTRHP